MSWRDGTSEGRLDPHDVAAGLLIKARALASGEAGDPGCPDHDGPPSPMALVRAVWAQVAPEYQAASSHAVALAEQAVERSWAAHDRDPAAVVAAFDVALEGLAASPQPSRRRSRRG